MKTFIVTIEWKHRERYLSTGGRTLYFVKAKSHDVAQQIALNRFEKCYLLDVSEVSSHFIPKKTEIDWLGNYAPIS